MKESERSKDVDYDLLNARRDELIIKQQTVGLTPDEYRELKLNNVLWLEYMNSLFTDA